MPSSPERSPERSHRIVGPIVKPSKDGIAPVPEIIPLDSLPFTIIGEVPALPPKYDHTDSIKIEGLEKQAWRLPMEAIVPFPHISKEYRNRDASYLEQQMREGGQKPILVAFIMVKGVKRALIIDGEHTFQILKQHGAKTALVRVTTITDFKDASIQSLRRNIGDDPRSLPMKTAYSIEKIKHTTQPCLSNTEIAMLVDRSPHTLLQYTSLLDLDMRTQELLASWDRGLSSSLGRKLAVLKRKMQQNRRCWNDFDEIVAPAIAESGVNPKKGWIPPQIVERLMAKKTPFYKESGADVVDLEAYEGNRDTTIQELRGEIESLRAQLAAALGKGNVDSQD